jgi:hypothetical protein
VKAVNLHFTLHPSAFILAFVFAARELKSRQRESHHARPKILRVEFFMSEHGKCPMGKHPWLATFFVLAFILVFIAHKLGLL